MKKIDLREVVDFIGTLPDELDSQELCEAVAERYAGLTQDEFRQVAALLRAQAEEAERQGAALEHILGIAERGNPSADEALGTTLGRLAAAGYPEAVAALAELRSPARRARDFWRVRRSFNNLPGARATLASVAIPRTR